MEVGLRGAQGSCSSLPHSSVRPYSPMTLTLYPRLSRCHDWGVAPVWVCVSVCVRARVCVNLSVYECLCLSLPLLSVSVSMSPSYLSQWMDACSLPSDWLANWLTHLLTHFHTHSPAVSMCVCSYISGSVRHLIRNNWSNNLLSFKGQNELRKAERMQFKGNREW